MVAVQLAAAALGRARLSPRCECVFIDVGLNTGRSLSTWPRVLHEAHTSHELPHGLHARLGSCLERSKKVGARRCWYGFEANPRYTEALRGIEWRMRRRGEREVVLHTAPPAPREAPQRRTRQSYFTQCSQKKVCEA